MTSLQSRGIYDMPSDIPIGRPITPTAGTSIHDMSSNILHMMINSPAQPSNSVESAVAEKRGYELPSSQTSADTSTGRIIVRDKVTGVIGNVSESDRGYGGSN